MTRLSLYLTAFCVVILGCGPKLPTARVTVKVIDDDNQPVPDARVVAMAFSTQKEGKTDQNGNFTAALKSATGQWDFVVEKQGFHAITWACYYFSGRTNDQLQPWNPTVELQLRRRGTPVPMVVKSVKGLPVPAKGEAVGYDLQVGDWVSPYGRGEVGDFIFTAESEIVDANNFNSRLLLTFSNPGDGLILRRVRYRDDYGLRLPAQAPLSGYTNRYQFILKAKQNPTNGIRDVDSTATDDDNYYLRVRTKQNEKGDVISAMYGKVYYGISLGPGFRHEGRPTLSFEYYLNPDGTRNTEFDTRSNLCPNPGAAGGRP